ncbi:PucR C-terminal helix-turn-helix domain-containing protein [Thermomonospora echinospora]|uniref:PucR C-terminal helix-turn-helix domain-containing protein n=1 Tax=Thermomonospora echinospora TaxID=1992 RepID=A0A1H6BFP5_9ACTN|nr:helix-turn-helix domain-containing protein [Thermomonospora echinospora]SEG59066.1 PucR C-terminal helix-turn-helix domain-containing protein [Thermomonospora echinospora]
MPSTTTLIPDENMAAVAAAASRRLLERLDDLTDRLVAEILAEDSGYAGFVPHDDLWRTVHGILGESIDHMGRRALGEEPAVEAAVSIGRRRAEQGLPLESLLRSFRIGGRLTWEAMIEVVAEEDPGSLPALLRFASIVWHTNEVQSNAVAESYRRTESELLRRSDERMAALLDALLEGRGADGGLTKAAAAALDLPVHGRYAVAVLRSPRRDPGFERPGRAGGLRFVWRMRADTEMAVVELGERHPADAAAALEPLFTGEAGISPAVDGLAALGRARWLAEVALQTCRPGDRRIARLDERLPAALVVSQPELSGYLGDTVLGPLADLDPVDREVLLETLATWLDCEGSAARTAGRLYCHRNTVFNRLRRLEQLTARSLHRPRDVVELALALDALDLVAAGDPAARERRPA